MRLKKKKYQNKPVPVHHIIQQVLNAKMKGKEVARVAANLKNSMYGNGLSQAFDKLFRASNKYQNLLWGNLFPQTVGELGEGNSYFFRSESVFADINWIYVQVKKYKKDISDFVVCRDKVEKYILLGYYDEAHAALDKLKSKLGMSVWYYEMKLLIYSYAGQEEKAIEMLSDINREKKDAKHGFVPFLLSYLFKRCSLSYSAYAYDTELENRFKMNRNDFQRDRYVYYLFRLNQYRMKDSEDLSPVLVMEATNSLIDRYLSLVNILRSSFTNTDDMVVRSDFAGFAVKLYRKVPDKMLAPLVAYSNKGVLKDAYYESAFIEILDSYYCGDYETCIHRCKKYILSNPSNLDVLKIYCRSLLATNAGYSAVVGNQVSIANKITFHIYKLMTDTENLEPLRHLYQINKNIYGLSLATSLDYYLSAVNNEKRHEGQKFLSAYTFDPMFCDIYTDIEKKNAYINDGQCILGSFLVLQYQLDRNKKDVSTCTSVVKYIRDIDAAEISYHNGDFEMSLELWNDILKDNDGKLPIVQNAIDYIYRCYVQLEEKQKAISFYVDKFLQGKAYVSLIDTSALENQLYKDKYRNGVKNGLDLQLFVFLNAKEDERKSAVLERFCAYKDAEKASDLIAELEIESDKQKVELYLYLLASEDILRHTLYITSTSAMLDEQQKIALYLTSLKNSEHYETYCSLHQEVLDSMIVYQNIKKVDESKIFVNQSALMKYEYKEYEELYHQFKQQMKLSASTNYFIVNTIDVNNGHSNDATIIEAPVRFTSKTFIDSACQLFTVIRDKFLTSKFGLKTYLSTRIRHGVLEGVLRSGFDSLHLLLSMQNNRYVPIQHWQSQYALNSKEQTDLMKILEHFSMGVNHTIDQFKENALQIKVSEEDKGLFDYTMTSDEMCYATVSADSKAKDFDEFCYYLMEYLLMKTNQCLINVRRELTCNAKTNLTNLVENLDKEIQQFASKHYYNDLNAAVNGARTEVNLKVAQIEKWFYLQDAKFDDFYLIQQMRVVWEITSKMYPNIEPIVKFGGLDNDVIIQSAYFTHISDLLTIFFDNMFSYSKSGNTSIFYLSLDREEDIITIHLENEIDEPEDVLNAKFKDMLQSYSRLQQEGHSGLVKVKKIIKYDLGCEQNELSIKADNGKCIVDVTINIQNICK